MATQFTKVNATSDNHSTITLAHGDLKTAQSSAECLYPSSITSTNVKWMRVGASVGSVSFRARYPTGASAAPATKPAIIIIGGWAYGAALQTIEDALAAGAAPTDGTFVTERLDAIDSDAAGIELTLDPTNDHRDGTYKYSDYFQFFPTSAIYGDTLGCPFLAVLCKTALAGGTGITTCDLLATFHPR